MGLNPAHRFDQARRQKKQTEQVRRLRVRPHGHAEAKNYIISGAVTTDLYIPPIFYAVDPDNTIPEIKLLFELRGVLRAGTCDITWTQNGSPLAGSDQTITTDPDDSIATLAAPGVRISHADYFQPTVASASGASDLTLVFFVVTRQV